MPLSLSPPFISGLQQNFHILASQFRSGRQQAKYVRLNAGISPEECVDQPSTEPSMGVGSIDIASASVRTDFVLMSLILHPYLPLITKNGDGR